MKNLSMKIFSLQEIYDNNKTKSENTMISNGDCMSCTHSLIVSRGYWATVIFNNFQVNYVVAANLSTLL